MSEAKPFASLSSGLLARKGAAKPAMRPQGFGNGSLEDLGWDDMGHGPDAQGDHGRELPEHVPSSIAALTPAPGGRTHHHEPVEEPVVVEQQRALEEYYAPEAEEEFEPEAEIEAEVEAEIEAETEAEAEVELAPEPEPEPEPEAVELEEPEPEVSLAEVAVAEPAAVPVYEPALVVQAPQPIARPASAKAKAAFTLRLDADRHLKLRLACAVTRRSAQHLVIEALDDLLNSLPQIEALARQVPDSDRRAG